MNGLMSMIGMQTELEYQMGDDFPFGSPRIRFNVPKGNIPSDKQKCQPKVQHCDFLNLKLLAINTIRRARYDLQKGTNEIHSRKVVRIV